MHKILLAGPGRVVINVSKVSFIGAAGLDALIALRVRAKQQHTALLLTDVPAAMLGMLKLTRLDDQFDYLIITEGGHSAKQAGNLPDRV
jgi:anti-anti-sigma factor